MPGSRSHTAALCTGRLLARALRRPPRATPSRPRVSYNISRACLLIFRYIRLPTYIVHATTCDSDGHSAANTACSEWRTKR